MKKIFPNWFGCKLYLYFALFLQVGSIKFMQYFNNLIQTLVLEKTRWKIKDDMNNSKKKKTLFSWYHKSSLLCSFILRNWAYAVAVKLATFHNRKIERDNRSSNLRAKSIYTRILTLLKHLYRSEYLQENHYYIQTIRHVDFWVWILI